jgi:hypothetical protein
MQMKQKLKAIFLKRPVVFYPLLFAAFPILFLYVHNISETSVSQIWLSLVISVAAALVLWAVLSLILRSLAKAGLATAIFLALFFSYGHLCDGLNYLGVFVPKHAHLLPVMLFIWGYCVYFISRAKSDFRITTKLFNITAVVLIAINLFNIGAYQVRLARLSNVTPVETPENTTSNSTELSSLPDIYLIITDEYAHPDTMKEWYDYDNSQFIESLEDRGFFVAHASKTPSINTQRSIASLLNMEYVDEAEMSVLVHKNADNKVVNFLKAKGYYYVCFGASPVFGAEEVGADVYYDFWEQGSSTTPQLEFLRLLYSTTMLRPFYGYFTEGAYENYYRRIPLNTLEHLKNVPELPGPKFVFAYLMSPHEPFVFGPDGEFIEPVNWTNYEDKRFYLGQYMFISDEIEKVLDAILENSVNETIIIIQSDHGLRPHHPNIEVGQDDWRKILNAYHLPGDGKELLYDSISPVNSFRLIFNHYLSADYELLPDY